MMTDPTLRSFLVVVVALLVIGAIWGFRKQAWPK
jgi:hypothetical protein